MYSSNNIKIMNNKQFSLGSVITIASIVLVLGYFLFRTSPQTVSQNSDKAFTQARASVGDTNLSVLVGKPLPDIQLTDKDGKKYTAESFKGKNTVLFFNEGLMCYPACWNQIAVFGSDARFNTDAVQAISVVMDSSREWQSAIEKMPELAKAKTLFDVSGDTSGKLGLLTLPSSMHRGSLPGHTYIVLDRNGIVREVRDDPNMAIANDILIEKIAKF